MKLEKNIWNPRSLNVIFVNLSKEKTSFSVVQVSQKKPLSDLNEVFFDTLDEIIAKYGNSTSYWIHVNGSGVLTRLIDRASGYKDDLIVNGNKDEFMFCSYTDQEKSAVSFVRSQSVQPFYDQLKDLRAHIIGISCGPIPIFGVLENNETCIGEYSLKYKDNKIETCSRNENYTGVTSFRAEKTTDNIILAFSLLEIMTKVKKDFEFCLTEENAKKELEEFKQHKKFNILGVGSVILLLIIVMGNYFYVNHLNNQIAQFETDLSLSNENLTLLDRLDQERSRKEQLVENSGFLGDKYISFYLDKIGQSVPGTIYLRTLDVFPLIEKLKEKRKVNVDSRRIELTGLTNSNVVLDDWIEKLNRYEWVLSVEVLNYTKITEGQAQFKLVMLLQK